MQSLFTTPAILASQKRIGSLREALLLKRSLLSCPGVRIQEQLDYFSLCKEQLRFFWVYLAMSFPSYLRAGCV